ncbi:MAG: phosphomannomutase, partial [Parasphingorhabdus sp.]
MTAPDTHEFHATSLREYDIRGIIGETLGADDAYAIGRGFGTLIARDNGTAVATGFDGRTSSPMLEDALVRGLNDAGVNAISVGMGPTPMLYYAESVLNQVQGGIMITGSHNPA